MVSKNQIKLISSLSQKKYREAHQLFVAEGYKVIDELLNSNFDLEQLYITEPLFDKVSDEKKSIISESDLKKLSGLSTPNNCLAVFKIPENNVITSQGLIVALDDIRDPGNLGTIIRLCDWFGITQIVCSESSVDVYNQKVIQSTMGSIARVNVAYVDLPSYLKKYKGQIFGTFMDGENVYQTKLPQSGVLVLGNEANGISKVIESLISHKIAIPRFGTLKKTESLNVATATAIFLSEFKRSEC